MSYEQITTLCVLGAALFLFVTELLPLGVTGLCIIAALGLTGVLKADEAAQAFSSPAVVLVGSLYVVSASLIRTGVIEVLDRRLLQLGQASERRLIVWSTLAAALASTLLNNTSIVVLMLPMLLAAAQRLKIAASRLLMPLSFAAILGGTMTLIGTSTNILVADLATRDPKHGFTIEFFDFLPVGAGFVAVGLLYLWFVAPHLLPARPTISAVTQGRAFEYVTELRVPQAGPATRMTGAQLMQRAGRAVRVLQVIRGEAILETSTAQLTPGDILVLRGPPEAILTLRSELRLAAADDAEPSGKTFAEIVITPASNLIGRTLAEVALKRTFGVVAIALQRRGAHLRHSIVEVPLRIGDVILVQGEPRRVEELRGQPGFLLLVGVDEKVVVRKRAPLAIGVLALFVVLAAIRTAPPALLAIAAAAACLATGCISLRAVIRTVDWNVLGLLAGALTLGLALHESKLAAEAAKLVVAATRDFGPWAVLCAIYLLTSIATEFVSNAGAAALMVPVAVATAVAARVSPEPFVFGVAFAASASFATPIGYQTNTFIYGPGGYRFRDFLRVGLPLQLLLWIYATFTLPVFFPFKPE